MLPLSTGLSYCDALPLWLRARARKAVVDAGAGAAERLEAVLVEKESEWVLGPSLELA